MNNSESENYLFEDQDPSIPSLISVPLVPSLPTSTTVRFSNPENPNSERQVAEIEVDDLLIRETDSRASTKNLLNNLSSELLEIDQNIDKISKRKLGTLIQKELEENYSKIKIDWTEDQLPTNTMADNTEHHQRTSQTNGNQIINVTEEQLAQLINQKVQEVLHLQNIPKTVEAMSDTQVRLQEAIKLLPKYLERENTEQLEIFLDKCEFKVSCTVPTAIPKLIQAIQTRLTGKARQATRNRVFETWEELKGLLKSSLEPKRTTQHLYQALYAVKQRPGITLFTYSKEVDSTK